MAFENLPDESRIWIYGFSQPLTTDQYNLLIGKLEKFKKEWMYHGNMVTGDYSVLENRFVILATNEAISGCSIDSSVAVFKQLKQETGLDALDQSLIFYRNKDLEIKAVSRREFQELLNCGDVNNHSIVFNLLINNLNAFKNGYFETEFENCWHSKFFKLPEEISS